MEKTKNFLTSKAIWGGLLVLAVTVANLLGYNLGDASGWADDIVKLFGAGFAIYGRVVAVEKITVLPQ